MFSTDSMRRWLALGIALGLAGGVAAATVVVRSNGPSAGLYPPGRMLDPAGTVMLKPGDSVTIVDAGGTRILSGAGKVPVAGRGGATGTGFGALLASAGTRQARTGATRGTNDGPPRPTNVWYVDATRGGTVCVANPAATMLWRPRFDAAESYTVADAATGKSAMVGFAAGQATRGWPADVPLAEGGSYRIAAGAAAQTVKVHVLTAVPDTLDAAAQALVARGCQAQVDLLIASTSER